MLKMKMMPAIAPGDINCHVSWTARYEGKEGVWASHVPADSVQLMLEKNVPTVVLQWDGLRFGELILVGSSLSDDEQREIAERIAHLIRKHGLPRRRSQPGKGRGAPRGHQG